MAKPNRKVPGASAACPTDPVDRGPTRRTHRGSFGPRPMRRTAAAGIVTMLLVAVTAGPAAAHAEYVVRSGDSCR